MFNVFHATQIGKNFGCQKTLVVWWEKAACNTEVSKSLFCEYAFFDASPNLSLSFSLVNVKQ